MNLKLAITIFLIVLFPKAHGQTLHVPEASGTISGLYKSVNGSVGIGTNNPKDKLEIYNGSIMLSPGINTPSGSLGRLNFSPGAGYFAQVAAYMGCSYEGVDWWSGTALVFGTNPGPDITSNSVTTERMRITKEGNVGIGTPSPSWKLHVKGAITADGDGSWGYSDFNLKNGNTRWHISGPRYGEGNRLGIFWNDGTSYYDYFTISTNGNVGIGINNPATKLDVAGSIQTRPLTVGNGANIIIGDDFINDGSIRRWVLDRRNDNYFGQENKGLVIWADKSNGYFAPLLLKEDGNLILVGANNAINKNVGIGILNPTYKLDVNGTIHAREVKVDLTGWSDFVFHPSYQLKPLVEVEQFIKTNGHLQDIPSAAEVEQNGVNVGEMQKKLLQKVEELTLYVIDLKKENEELKKQGKELKQESDQNLEVLKAEIEKLKKNNL